MLLSHTSLRVSGFEAVRKIWVSNDGTHSHTHQFSQSGHSRSRFWLVMLCSIARPERAYQNNAQSRRSSRTNRQLSRQFWEDLVAVFAFLVWDKNKNPFWMGCLTLIFTLSVELRTHLASRVAQYQLTSWRSVSMKPCTCFFFFNIA